MATIKCLLNKLKDKFEIIIPLDNYYLGLEIGCDRQNGIIKVHQSAYTKNVLKRLNMDSANAVSVPDVHTILKKNISNNDQSNFIADVPYR